MLDIKGKETMAKDYGRREAIGNHFILWVPEDGHVEGEDRVVISSHGAYHPCFTFKMADHWELHFFSKLGQPLSGFCGPWKVESRDPVEIVTSKSAKRAQNYFLSLYQTKTADKLGEESFQDIRNFVEEKQVCVVTVRPYHILRSDMFSRFRRLSNLLYRLDKAHKNRFNTVLCSFCRSHAIWDSKEPAAGGIDIDDFEVVKPVQIA